MENKLELQTIVTNGKVTTSSNDKFTPVIMNESVPADLERFVAYIRVWIPERNVWNYYYYMKTLTKPQRINIDTIVQAIKSYQGSSKGKNIPSPELMRDWSKTTKPPEIKLLELNPPRIKLGFWEQYHTTLHRHGDEFPNHNGVDTKENCYNKKNVAVKDKKYGFTTHEKMMSYIAKKMLTNEFSKLKNDKSYQFPFKRRSLSRKILSTIMKL